MSKGNGSKNWSTVPTVKFSPTRKKELEKLFEERVEQYLGDPTIKELVQRYRKKIDLQEEIFASPIDVHEAFDAVVVAHCFADHEPVDLAKKVESNLVMVRAMCRHYKKLADIWKENCDALCELVKNDDV